MGVDFYILFINCQFETTNAFQEATWQIKVTAQWQNAVTELHFTLRLSNNMVG